MELTKEDIERIEQAEKLAWKNTITAFENSDSVPFWEGYTTGAKYATKYERERQAGRFKMPEPKQIIDIAILFNDGKLDAEKLSDMVAMCDFVIDRLYENGDVTKPSKKENEP